MTRTTNIFKTYIILLLCLAQLKPGLSHTCVSDWLPSDTHHGAEAFGAQRHARVTSGATVFAPQRASNALAVLCNLTGPAVSPTCAHTHTHTLDPPTPPHHQPLGHCFPSQSLRTLTDWPPGGSLLALHPDWYLSPGIQEVKLAAFLTVRMEPSVQKK